MARGVARDVEDLEAGDLVALVRAGGRRGGRARSCLGEELRHEVVGLALADELGVLGGVDVPLPHPEGDAEALADGVAGALVVGVGVGERVRGERVALELAMISRVA